MPKLFNIESFGSNAYTGLVVLSPGPGLDLGLSAAAACGCCSADQRLVIRFSAGVQIETYILAGSVRTELNDLTLPETGGAYYRVSYVPGKSKQSACCGCLSQAYELTIAPDEVGLDWADYHKKLKTRGTTGKQVGDLLLALAKLQAENDGFRRRLGLPVGASTGDNKTGCSTAELIQNVLKKGGGCCG